MAADEGDQPDEQPGESQIAGAVEEALQPEVRRALAPPFERPAVPHDEPRSPREQQDEILDELRWKDPGA
ncbi:hypothetical protein ACQPX6_01875 [Actinomycetospora sp. CA-101289]|uniref:hypothetical protein n=1 Tax=Actinomycetospora sp. CA-101289 TaxID=3239893 RepID=UPI003D973DA4